jgi:hypothetical protein
MEIPDKAPENLSKQPDQGRKPTGEDPPMTMKENVVPSHTRPQGSTVPPSGRDHEYKDISFGSITRFVVVLIVLCAVSSALMWGMFEILEERHAMSDQRPNPMSDTTDRLPPLPRLQVNERMDIASFRQREDSMLKAYGWLDRSRGAARIPIDRAIDLIAEKGLPGPALPSGNAPAGDRDDSTARSGGINFGPPREPNNGPSIDRTVPNPAPANKP